MITENIFIYDTTNQQNNICMMKRWRRVDIGIVSLYLRVYLETKIDRYTLFNIYV
jgi:hypothetical protein